MIEDAVKLTKRESEIAELFAWGASKKRHCEPPFHFGKNG